MPCTVAGTLYASGGLAITIEDAVRQALASNPEALRAVTDIRAAGHDVKQARAGYLPSLDIETRYGREHTHIKQQSVLEYRSKPVLKERDSALRQR